MIVGMDISQVAHMGGVGVYTQNLAEQLVKLSELEMKFFYSSLRKPYQGNLPNVKQFKIPPTVFELLFNNLRYPVIESLIGEIDVFHSSDWGQPKTKAKKVTTYHDVIPLKFPNWSHPKIVTVHKKRLEIVEKEIDMVIAVSESTKKDLLELTKIPEEKIVVVYEGVDDIFKPQREEDIEKFKLKYKLPDNFILSIGGIGERRNMDKIKEISKYHNLVVTGKDLFVERVELPLLYCSAQVLLYPSLYEGFGLPIVEAMACGTPVITSNISSMPEVGGEAALSVDPNDTNDISNKLFDVTRDKNLRSIMIKKGFVQAKKFSWEKCARETLGVYQRVMTSK